MGGTRRDRTAARKQENDLLKKLGLQDKFIFLYAGNMGHPQDVESIIECAEKLKDHPEIRFLFIGNGVKRKWIENEISQKKLSNVILLDPSAARSTDIISQCLRCRFCFIGQ